MQFLARGVLHQIGDRTRKRWDLPVVTGNPGVVVRLLSSRGGRVIVAELVTRGGLGWTFGGPLTSQQPGDNQGVQHVDRAGGWTRVL